MERILELVKELQEEYKKSYGVYVTVNTTAFEEGGFPTEKHAKAMTEDFMKHLNCQYYDMPGKQCSAVKAYSDEQEFEQTIYYPAVKEE